MAPQPLPLGSVRLDSPAALPPHLRARTLLPVEAIQLIQVTFDRIEWKGRKKEQNKETKEAGKKIKNKNKNKAKQANKKQINKQKKFGGARPY